MAEARGSGCRVGPGLGGLGLVGPTIRILVGFPPGGGSDAIARLLADKLKDELGGVTVLVENRPGAGGQIAAQLLKASPADGHTLFLTHDHTISILPKVVKSRASIRNRTSFPWPGSPLS
jgi:tripartite-type tricarboxylate transporter receptor subunit TctC